MTEIPAAPLRYPSLRSAMWLYFIVLLLTAIVVNAYSPHVEVAFLRLIAALLAGLATIVALVITRTDAGAVLGRAPRLIDLILSFVIGVALWLVVYWLIFVLFNFLDIAIGLLLSPSPVTTGATRTAVFIQLGFIVPFTEGFLFWAYLQRAAESVGRTWSVVLTAILFALFALFSTDYGISGVLPYLLIGLIVALVVDVTGSAWCGIAAFSGYSIMLPLLENTPQQISLFQFLNSVPGNQLFGPRWLLAIAICAFLTFILLQIIRARHSKVETSERAKVRRLWWLPLIFSLVVILAAGYTEIIDRKIHRVVPRPTPGDIGPSSPLPATLPPTPGR